MSIKVFNGSAENYYDTYNGRHAKKVIGFVNKTADRHMKNSGTLLDVGCGTGSLIRELAKKHEQWKYRGIDLSDKMIDICERNKAEGQEYLIASAEKIPYDDNSFKLVTCTDSFHHYVNPEKALKEMYRVLDANSYLIMSEIWLPVIIRQITNIGLKLINTGDIRVYGKRLLTRMLADAGFKDIEFYVRTPMIYECVAKKG